MNPNNGDFLDRGNHLKLVKKSSEVSPSHPLNSIGGLKKLDRVPPSGWRLVEEGFDTPSREDDIERARELAKSAPEIRSEKVQRLKAAIQEDRYHVDAETLAESLLRDSLLNNPE
jgi:flagellar biosynthesis anti-sigma factor FlgM